MKILICLLLFFLLSVGNTTCPDKCVGTTIHNSADDSCTNVFSDSLLGEVAFSMPLGWANCCTYIKNANPNAPPSWFFECLECRPGFYVVGNDAPVVLTNSVANGCSDTPPPPSCTDTNCNDCTGNVGICITCKAGFYLNEGGCLSCPRRCATCDSPKKCTSCKPRNL